MSEPDSSPLGDLLKRKEALDAQADEIVSIVSIWPSDVIAPDVEWKGQGSIQNAEQWVALLKAIRALKHNPELKATVDGDARKLFHALNERIDLAQQEAPHDYQRFITEGKRVADELRELVDSI